MRCRFSFRLFVAIFVAASLTLQQTSAVGQEAASTSTVWALTLTSGQARELFSIPGTGNVSSVAVSPDQQTFLYSGTRDHTDGNVNHLWSCNANGTDHRDLGHGMMPSWSPGGNRIVFAKEAAAPGVWVMRSDGSDQQIIDRFGSNPQWSDDGRSIAYIRQKNNTANSKRIVMYDVAEQTFEELAADFDAVAERPNSRLAWSPDLHQIAVAEPNAEGDDQIRIVPLKTGSPIESKSLPSTNFVSQLVWINEQQLLLTSRQSERDPWQLVTINLNGESKQPERLTGQPKDQSQHTASISRDRQTLYYISRSIR